MTLYHILRQMRRAVLSHHLLFAWIKEFRSTVSPLAFICNFKKMLPSSARLDAHGSHAGNPFNNAALLTNDDDDDLRSRSVCPHAADHAVACANRNGSHHLAAMDNIAILF